MTNANSGAQEAPAPATVDELMALIEEYGQARAETALFNAKVLPAGAVCGLPGARLGKVRRALATSLAPATGVEARPAGVRSPADYAIEHAEYMAVEAERLLAELSLEGTALTTEELETAILNKCEAVKRLHSAVYEFRKRRDRALLAAQHSASRSGSDPEPVTIQKTIVTFVDRCPRCGTDLPNSEKPS